MQAHHQSDLLTHGSRDAFATFVMNREVSKALKSLMLAEPEPFQESSETLRYDVPSIVLNVGNTGNSFLFNHQACITLGREDALHGIFPSVNLQHYSGAEMGVSRRHAKITFQDGKFYLMDLGSSNGTKINDEPIAPRQMTPIYDGDVISLGKLKLVVSL